MIMCGSISAFQGRFADALLRELAGVTIPPERIFGLGTGLSTFQINNITTVIRIGITFFFCHYPTFLTILKFSTSPKVEVLKQLQKKQENQGLTLQ